MVKNKRAEGKDVVLLQIGTPDVRYAALKAGTVRRRCSPRPRACKPWKEGFRELPYHQQNHVESGDVFDLSVAKEAQAELKKMMWEP